MAKKVTKVDWEALRETVKNTDKAVLTKVVQSIDGHTIYEAKHFTEKGLDESVVNAFAKTLKSGKGQELPQSPWPFTIVPPGGHGNCPVWRVCDNNGVAVKSIKGVYGLDLLTFIANVFGVDSWKMGRGSRAQHLAEQLVECNFTKQEEAKV